MRIKSKRGDKKLHIKSYEIFQRPNDYNVQIKTGRLKRSQFSIQLFISWKLQKLFYFLTCILADFVADEITKEFWKSSHFENITAGFLLRCQNTLRWNTPEKMRFTGVKYPFFTHIALLIVMVFTRCILCCI